MAGAGAARPDGAVGSLRAEPPPGVVEALGPLGRALEGYAALLAGAGVEWGLLGPREVPRLWQRHLLNCLAVAPLVPVGARLADVGSGAGLPGLVVALARPDVDVVLVEPLQRRTRFLADALATLDEVDPTLGRRVTVAPHRAGDLAAGGFTAVTARALAPLDRLVGWCAPLLRPGGVLLALKGRRAAVELATSASAVAAAGIRAVEVLHVTTDPAALRAALLATHAAARHIGDVPPGPDAAGPTPTAAASPAGHGEPATLVRGYRVADGRPGQGARSRTTSRRRSTPTAR